MVFPPFHSHATPHWALGSITNKIMKVGLLLFRTSKLDEQRRAETRDTPPKHLERSELFTELPTEHQNLVYQNIKISFEQKTVATAAIRRAAAPTRFRTCAVA